MLLLRRAPWRAPLFMAASAVVASAAPLPAQPAPASAASGVSLPDVTLRDQVRAWRHAHEAEILGELTALLAIPNLASDSGHVARNAAALVAMLERRGVRARLLETPGSPPAVLGELVTPGATRTLVLYAHYDGQPVDASQWATAPWQPTLRDAPLASGGRVIPLPAAGDTVSGASRLYARSASDDKAPIVAMLAALDALRAAGAAPSVNLKLLFEGEEEAGSPHLRELLTRHAEALRGDLWLFADGPAHPSGRLQVVFGVRGVTGVEMTTYGPARALHSGHYGNWAPNPVAELATILAGMRDLDGRILVRGFYDDVAPITAAERRALAAVPRVDTTLRRSLALGATEAGNASLAERIMLPAMNLRGIRGGAVGAQAANAIPTEATASIDFRLVPHQTPEHVRELVEAHLRRQGWTVVHEAPDAATRLAHPRIVRLDWEAGYPSVRTPLDLPASRAVVKLVGEATGEPPVVLPTMGGSLPTYVFEDVLHAPLIVLPTVNADNNQHAANENLRLQNLWDGIDVFALLMARLGAEWR